MISYHYYFGNNDNNEEEEESAASGPPQDVEYLIVDSSSVPVIPAEFCFFRFRQLSRVDLTNGSGNGSILNRIGRLAFGWCNLLTQIEIPSSVTVIEEGAFESCISLETVILQQQEDASCLVTIGERAFNCCESLEEIIIPSSVKTIQDCAFRRCTSMVQVSFCDGSLLQVIGNASFQECTALERVNLPRTVETLGSEAFRDCSSLWEVNLSSAEGLHEIGSRAFYRCSSLYRIILWNNNNNTRGIFNNTMQTREEQLRYTTTAGGIQIIGEYAFCGCEGLTSIALPPSVATIDTGAFRDCSNLVSVELIADDSSKKAIRIEYSAFYCCESLVNISLPTADEVVEGFGSCTWLCEQYGADNLPNALMDRFDLYPIHRKCYHASVTTADELIQEIQKLLVQNGSNNDCQLRSLLVDPFGMTPFHILLSAANGANRLDLLHILLFSFPPQVLGWKDTFGMFAVDYCWGYQWNEDTRRLIRMILRRWMVGSIASWGGLQSWQMETSNLIELFLAEDDEERCNNLFKSLRLKLATLELRENSSLLELKLWKTEMMKHTHNHDDDMEGTTIMTEHDREICRIQCGASIVLPNVLGFLSIDPLAVLS
mmetsp:Transcript_37000/g.89910  ORF Transcript_37000/g.89910 Transcript_37000/m.89910 type:complete len:601 (-) Transcript_37000:9-1811(-)